MKMNIKNMKTVWGAWICLGLLVPTACSDMFETDSTSVVFESGNRLDSPNDSLYSIMGILAPNTEVRRQVCTDGGITWRFNGDHGQCGCRPSGNIQI